MAQTFGALTPIEITKSNRCIAHVQMPNGDPITLTIEVPPDGSGAFLMVRGADGIEVRPVAGNTVGIRVTPS